MGSWQGPSYLQKLGEGASTSSAIAFLFFSETRQNLIMVDMSLNGHILIGIEFFTFRDAPNENDKGANRFYVAITSCGGVFIFPIQLIQA